MPSPTLFQDRREAGRRLADALLRFKDAKPLILALPRGGVPVGFEVARRLGAALDVLLVRKIGAPGHEELGLGAVVDGSHAEVVLNESLVRLLQPDAGYIAEQRDRQLAEIERRRRLYRGREPSPSVEGRCVIVVDDGIATGGTVKAALRGIRRAGPGRLVLAVPVAPPDALSELAAECDEIICLAAPEDFGAVGAHYADFSQTSDQDVVRLLAAARAFRPSETPTPASDAG